MIARVSGTANTSTDRQGHRIDLAYNGLVVLLACYSHSVDDRNLNVRILRYGSP